ncbi:MAG: hypothetical protein K2N14_02630, partial [Clostridia bacterium]|nr:hypothetical protein [Clostridia bacterium]
MDYKFDDFKDDYDEDEDYIDREDELAFMHSLCSAFNGDVASMRVLGDIYSSSGHGVVKDYNKAAYWYKRAADCGDNNCLLCLADIYFDGGDDFPKDYDKAFSLYELAEEEGSIRGAARLGIMYLYGMGCDKDFKAARKLLERAAKENDREACCEYALILKAEGAEDWFEYLEKSARQSYGKACWEIIESFADKIDDKQTEQLSAEIATRIQNEMTY